MKPNIYMWGKIQICFNQRAKKGYDCSTGCSCELQFESLMKLWNIFIPTQQETFQALQFVLWPQVSMMVPNMCLLGGDGSRSSSHVLHTELPLGGCCCSFNNLVADATMLCIGYHGNRKGDALNQLIQ